jgi:hypothetical protein
MAQQLELDLWQLLAVARVAPATASMLALCGHLEGLDLVDGARAIWELAEIYRSKAEVVLTEIAVAYLPLQEPVVVDELWAHLYQRSFVLWDEHLFWESEHDYPVGRQSVVRLGVAADELISDELQRAEVARQVLGNAHCEDVELWAGRIRVVVVEFGEISLLELVKRSGLSLVDVWLGLLLGDTGCLVRRGSKGFDDFYACDGIWVVAMIDI